MRMFQGKDFTKGLKRLEWGKVEAVVIKPARPMSITTSKILRAAAKKSRVRYVDV